MKLENQSMKLFSVEFMMKFLTIGSILFLIILNLIYNDNEKSTRMTHIIYGISGSIISWKYMRSKYKVNSWFMVIPFFILIADIILISLTFDTPNRSDVIRALIAPFTEEVFFRGILLKPAHKTKHNSMKILIIVLASLLFAYSHGQYWDKPDDLINTFVFGLISSIIFCYSRYLPITMTIHYLINFGVTLRDVIF